MIDRIAFRVQCLRREWTRRRLRAVEYPDQPVLAQGRAWPGRARLRAPWADCRFVVFDTETTGLDPDQDRPLSLGAVAVVQGRLALGDRFYRLLDAGRPSSSRSVVVHGLTSEKVAGGVAPALALTEFLNWADDAILVAHHAAFDLAMLNPVAIAAWGTPIQNLILDTAELAPRLERARQQDYSLDALLARHYIPVGEGRHDALGDALLTARLLQVLLKRLRARGVRTLEELARPALRDPVEW